MALGGLCVKSDCARHPCPPSDRIVADLVVPAPRAAPRVSISRTEGGCAPGDRVQASATSRKTRLFLRADGNCCGCSVHRNKRSISVPSGVEGYRPDSVDEHPFGQYPASGQGSHTDAPRCGGPEARGKSMSSHVSACHSCARIERVCIRAAKGPTVKPLHRARTPEVVHIQPSSCDP